jgi:carboxyl-terminal processing protease
MEKLKQLSVKFRVYIVILASTGLGFFSYSFVDNYFEVSKNLDIFATLFRELNIYYVDDTSPGDLMKKGIDSMLESLDPYTNYIPESDIEEYRYMTTGQYGGIGCLIRQDGEYIVVAEPYEGYPAYKADLRAGDRIIEVNGVSAVGKKTDDLTKILKGQPNTNVKLIIEREGEKKRLEKTLQREEIKIKNVPYYGMINENTGYIKLTGFTDDAAKEVKGALIELKSNPAMKSIVLDLRGNPGGLLREAVDIVNIFVDKDQEIVSTRGKIKEWDKSHKATNQPVDLSTPLVVLVDRGSASASEIVSGAIQDLDRGVVIGQRTFGKGLVQQTRPLSYNAQLKVTVAKYYTPSGRCIQALDYTHRAGDGSVTHIPDSLISAFKTKNGRIVYDGGGVDPDIAIEPFKYSNIAASLVSKSHVFKYANRYRMTHASIPPAKDFRLTDAEYNDFMSYLTDKEYDYVTKSEKSLNDLQASAQKEKYYEDIKSEFEALKLKMMHNKKDDLIKFKPEIKELLETEIATRYYFQKGKQESILKDDPIVAEANKVLQDNARYKSILTTIVKATKPFMGEKRPPAPKVIEQKKKEVPAGDIEEEDEEQ